jgi:glycosyltransferase involved in cell wall biosynthesis
LSETFIAQEIRALEDAGLPLTIVSLRAPTDRDVHAVHREIAAPVLYLPEYLLRAPMRVWRAWRRAQQLPGYAAARAVWARDLARDPTPNRFRRFGQALVLAAELDPGVRHLHAHFLHTPASVARYAALLTGRTWSASAHAVDIYTTPDWELRDKIASADWLVTCTAANRAHLQARAQEPGKVGFVYHGIDLTRFARPRDRAAAVGPTRILSVCRLVEKKGTDDLLHALARLPADLDWRFVHVGGGPLARKMERLAERLGIADRVSWRGPLPQDRLLAEYRAADVFALASRIAGDGDRDGLPNVLIEAASQALPCIATRISAIPELIDDGANGILVDAGDIAGLMDALARLIDDPALRARLGAAGADRVCRDFDLGRCIAALLPRFGLGETRAIKVA